METTIRMVADNHNNYQFGRLIIYRVGRERRERRYYKRHLLGHAQFTACLTVGISRIVVPAGKADLSR